jgi:uncharacterized protein (DUF2147 family)
MTKLFKIAQASLLTLVSAIWIIGTPAAPAPTATARSPIGLWMADKNEGMIRIEACGGNLCGWGIEKDGSKSAKMVLINMKPQGEKWVGRVHDPRGGGTYDSNIALRGNDKLWVTGCVMLFCQAQTWTRIE